MKHLLVDTNILLDLLAKREPFYPSAARLFTLADENEIRLSVSALTIANTNYILGQQLKAVKCKEILRKTMVLFHTEMLDTKIIQLALNDSSFEDFEDGIQYYTAMENNMDIIVSRDLKGFKSSTVPVMTAEEFLKSVSIQSKGS